MIIVMQRLHVNDLTGFAQESGGFEKLSLPAIATSDTSIPVSATESYYRKEGEPLHAEYEDLNTLERIRDQIGAYNFASQYQQSPETPSGGRGDCRRVRSTLLQNLMRQNLLRPDTLFLGVETVENGALLNNCGIASDVLYTVGPLRKGNLWESIAVPEIRVQVAELAAHLVAGFRLRTRVTHTNQLTAVG